MNKTDKPDGRPEEVAKHDSDRKQTRETLDASMLKQRGEKIGVLSSEEAQALARGIYPGLCTRTAHVKAACESRRPYGESSSLDED